MKLYSFGEYKIKVLESPEEIKNTVLEGCRSICGSKAIEIIGGNFDKKVKEWAFCHLIKEIENKYFIILKEVI